MSDLKDRRLAGLPDGALALYVKFQGLESQRILESQWDQADPDFLKTRIIGIHSLFELMPDHDEVTVVEWWMCLGRHGLICDFDKVPGLNNFFDGAIAKNSSCIPAEDRQALHQYGRMIARRMQGSQFETKWHKISRVRAIRRALTHAKNAIFGDSAPSVWGFILRSAGLPTDRQWARRIAWAHAVGCVEYGRPGAVYIAQNEDLPGLVKIGYTSGSVQERVKMLRKSHNPGGSKHFTVSFEHACGDAYAAEQLAHSFLSMHRVGEKELFRCSLESAIRAVVVAGEFSSHRYLAADVNALCPEMGSTQGGQE